MIVVLVSAIVLGVIGREKRRIDAMNAAINEVTSSGGGVGFYFETMNPQPGPGSSLPVRMLQRLHASTFREVTSVGWRPQFGGMLAPDALKNEQLNVVKKFPSLERVAIFDSNNITDLGLTYLEGLDRLNHLTLCRVNVTDEGLKQIGLIKSLHSLDLQHLAITNEGMKHLAKLDLKTLILANCRVDGGGLKALDAAANLSSLRLYNLPFGDSDMAELNRFKGLRHLAIEGTNLTEEAFDALVPSKELLDLNMGAELSSDIALAKVATKFPNLLILVTNGRKVTDAGLGELTKRPSIIRLTLNGSSITDSGLKLFDKMPALQAIDLIGTDVSKEAIDSLKSRRPGLQIRYVPTIKNEGPHTW